MLTIYDLFHAIILDDTNKIEKIIAAGVDINELYQGNSALHFAVKLTKHKALQQLVALKANLAMCDAEGYTALGRAVLAGDEVAVAILMPDVAAVSILDINKRSPLHIAVTNGKHAILQQLIKAGSQLIIYDHGGYTPLGRAVEADDLVAMSALLQAGAGIDTVDQADRAPVHVAIFRNKVKALQHLISLGANLNLKTKYGSVLCLAMQKKRSHCVDALLQAGVNPDSRNSGGQSALVEAINADDLMLVKLLLQYGADVNAKNPITSWTPFMEAIVQPYDQHRKNDLAILNELHKAGAKIESYDKRNTPLPILAAENDGVAGITFLDQQGVDVAQKFQDDGGEYGAISAAIKESCVDALYTLIKCCPSIVLGTYTRQYGAESFQSCSVMQLAIKREIERRLELQNYKQRKDAKQSIIVNKEIEVKAAEAISAVIIERVALGDPAYFETLSPIILFQALKGAASLTTIISLLLQGCSPNIPIGEGGSTPFLLAIALKNITVDYVQALIEHGALLTQTLEDGRTALHVAIFAKKLDVIRLLLKQPQIDVNQANRKGCTPLEIAFEEKCDAEIIDTLLAVSNIDVCVTIEKLIAEKAKDILEKLLTYQNYRLLQMLAASNNADVMQNTYSLLPRLIKEAYETLVKTNLPVALTLLNMSEEFFYDITTDYIRKNRNDFLKKVITHSSASAQSRLLLQVARAKKAELFKLLIAEIQVTAADIACAALQQEKKEKEVILFLLTEDSVFKQVLTQLFLKQDYENLKLLANWQPERLCKLFLEIPSLTDQMLVELYAQFTPEKQITLLSKVLENEDTSKLNLLLKQMPNLDLSNKSIGKDIALFAAAHKQQELLKCLQACHVNMYKILLEEKDFALIQGLLELVEIDVEILLAICRLHKLENFLQLGKNISHELLPVLLKRLIDDDLSSSILVLLRNYINYIEIKQRKEAMAFVIEKRGRYAVQELSLLANSLCSLEMKVEIFIILTLQNKSKILREEIKKLTNHDEVVELILATSPVMLLSLLEEELSLSSLTTNKVMDYGVSEKNVNLVFKLFKDYADFINVETQRQGLLLLLQKNEVQFLSVLCQIEKWKTAILQLGKEKENETILRKLSLIVTENFSAKAESSDTTTVEATEDDTENAVEEIIITPMINNPVKKAVSFAESTLDNEEKLTAATLLAAEIKSMAAKKTSSAVDTENAAEEIITPMINNPVKKAVSFAESALDNEEKLPAATLLAAEIESMDAKKTSGEHPAAMLENPRGRQVKVTILHEPLPWSESNTFTPIREVSSQQQAPQDIAQASIPRPVQVSMPASTQQQAAIQKQAYFACVTMLNIDHASAPMYIQAYQLNLKQLLYIAYQNHLWRAVENIVNYWLPQEKQGIISSLLADNHQAGVEQLINSLEPTLLAPAMLWAIQNHTLPLARSLLSNRNYLDHVCLCFLAAQDYINLWKLYSIQKNDLPKYFFSQLAALAAEKNPNLVFTICEIERKGLLEYVYPQLLTIAEELSIENIMQSVHHEEFLQEAIVIAEKLKIVNIQIKLQLCLTEFYLVMENDGRKVPYYIPLKQYDLALKSLQAILTISAMYPESCTVEMQEKITLIQNELSQRTIIIRKIYLEHDIKTLISLVPEIAPMTIHQLIDREEFLKKAILMAHVSAKINVQIKLQLCLCEFYLAMDKQDIRRLPYQNLQAQCDLTQKYLQDTLELVHVYPELCTAEVMMQVQNIHAGLNEKLKKIMRVHFSTGQFAPTYQSSNIPFWKKPFTFDPTVRTAYIRDFADFTKESKLNWEEAAKGKKADNMASVAPQLC